MSSYPKVHAYATFEKGGEKKEHQFELSTLPEDYVDVKVTHSGIRNLPHHYNTQYERKPQTRKHTNTQTRKHANTQTRKHANAQTYKQTQNTNL
jgi:hypothetical protein